MPLIMLNVGSGLNNVGSVLNNVQLIMLLNGLPKIVADALTCENPDGKLTPADVEIWTREASINDRGSDNLQIVIFANSYPERLANLNDRQKIITEAVRKYLPPRVHGWVWIRLAESSCGIF
jgi:hypothetical protein